MAYEGRCGTCGNFEDNKGEKYDKNNPDYVKGYCNWYGCYYYPDDSCEDHYRKRESSSDGGCYITTMICNKMGLQDDCDALNTLRGFRDNVLQKNQKYKELLFEYDVVGPKISECLQEEKKPFVEEIYHSFIMPIVTMIKNGQNEEAVQKYVTMTKSLKDYYAIDSEVNVPVHYDYTVGGHGYLKTKQIPCN